MRAKNVHPEKPKQASLKSLRRRMVRELEEFLSAAIRLPLPRLKLKPRIVGKYQASLV